MSLRIDNLVYDFCPEDCPHFDAISGYKMENGKWLVYCGCSHYEVCGDAVEQAEKVKEAKE